MAEAVADGVFDGLSDAVSDAVGGDLVIGLGNPLRNDDGVGWWLAQRAESQRAAPRVLMVQQLTPELSLELAVVRRVLFLDAWLVAAEGQAAQPLPPDGRARAPGPSVSCHGPATWAPGTDLKAPWRSARRDVAGEPAAAPHAPCLRRLPPPLPGGDPAGGGEDPGAFSHGYRPSQLVAITAWLHGRTPEAWMLLVPAFDLAHGTALSPGLRRLLPQAEALLWQWCSAREPCGVAAGSGDA